MVVVCEIVGLVKRVVGDTERYTRMLYKSLYYHRFIRKYKIMLSLNQDCLKVFPKNQLFRKNKIIKIAVISRSNSIFSTQLRFFFKFCDFY